MKQVLQSYRTGELWLAEVPSPACLANGIRVQVSASLVSAGTERRMIDLAKASLLQKALKRPDQVARIVQKIKTEGLIATWHQVNAKLETPVPLGYSASGVVVEVGASAAGEFEVGQRVACAGVGYANHAEFIAVPKTLAVRMPTGLSFEHASFGTLGAIALQAVRQAEPQLGELIGVIGLGLLGNLVAQILVASGARVVGTDLDSGKQKLAQECGVELVGHDIKALADQISGDRGLDKIIVAAASPESGIIRSCPPALRHRGRIVVLGFVGMDCPHQLFYNKELELRMSMSYGPGRYDPQYEEKAQDYPYPFVRWTEQRNLEAFLQLVAQGRVKIEPLISHYFAFDNALSAYSLLQSRERYLGIVLRYPIETAGAGSQVIRIKAAAAPAGTSPVKLAIVGAGNFVSGVMAPILRKLRVPVYSVVSNRGPSALNSAKAIGAETAATNLELVLSEPSVSHVLIATRHAVHAEQTEAALRAGKFVHTEKPLCTTRRQLAKLNEVVVELNVADRVTVGFNRRYSPLSELLLAEIRKKPACPLTVIYRINAGVLPDGHWFYDDPGGRLTAEGCHFVDYCEFLVGKPLKEVGCSAQGGAMRPFDSFIVNLSFADGSQAAVIYSGQGDRAMPKERIEVFQGQACWVNEDWSSLVRFQNGKRHKLYRGRQQKGWHEEMEHFLNLKTHSCAPEWSDIVRVHKTVFDAVDVALGSANTDDER